MLLSWLKWKDADWFHRRKSQWKRCLPELLKAGVWILEMDSKIRNLVVGISLISTSNSYRVLQVSLYRNFPVQRRSNFTLSGHLKKVHFLLAGNKNDKCSDKLARHLNVISRLLPGAAALSLGQKHRNDERNGDYDTRAATESLVRPPLPAALTGPGKLTVCSHGTDVITL